MIDWPNADEARRIATGELPKIMHKITEAAYKGGFQITLDYSISVDISEVLRNFGYEISYDEIPIYEETPYGVRYNIIGYKPQTTISWYENINNS